MVMGMVKIIVMIISMSKEHRHNIGMVKIVVASRSCAFNGQDMIMVMVKVMVMAEVLFLV